MSSLDMSLDDIAKANVRMQGNNSEGAAEEAPALLLCRTRAASNPRQQPYECNRHNQMRFLFRRAIYDGCTAVRRGMHGDKMTLFVMAHRLLRRPPLACVFLS